MADSPAGADVDPTPDPPGPVDTQDRTLADLQREIRRQGRSGRWVAASMVAIAVGFVVLLAVVVPAQFVQAFGLADVRVAVVESIGLSEDQPNPGSVRRSGPKWDVQVRWDGDGGVHRGSGIARGDDPPYQVGEEVDIATVGDGNEVSLRSRAEAWGVLAAILGVVAICLAVGSYYWFRSRAWRPLSTAVTTTTPKRVRVHDAPVRHQRRNSRIDVLERGHIVDYEAVGGNPDAGSFLLLRAKHGEVAAADDVLDLWTPKNQGPPFAVRRPSDGLWWLGSDSG